VLGQIGRDGGQAHAFGLLVDVGRLVPVAELQHGLHDVGALLQIGTCMLNFAVTTSTTFLTRRCCTSRLVLSW